MSLFFFHTISLLSYLVRIMQESLIYQHIEEIPQFIKDISDKLLIIEMLGHD